MRLQKRFCQPSHATMRPEKLWPAVVVGAGPAGAVAARELARAKIEVLLVDKATFPRQKVCGGCLGRAAIELLRDCGLQHLPGQLGHGPRTRCVYMPATGRLHWRCQQVSRSHVRCLMRHSFGKQLPRGPLP